LYICDTEDIKGEGAFYKMEDAVDEFPIQIFMHQFVHMMGYFAMTKMQKLNLKPGQAGILFVLSKKGAISQKDLAKKIGITPPSMTVALKKLEIMGYVEKQVDDKDQRIIRITATEEGEKVTKEMVDAMREVDDLIYKGISKEERMLFRRLIVQMNANLKEAQVSLGADVKQMRAMMKAKCQDM
jgi:DNA-binding MarR family transcriptional regulator